MKFSKTAVGILAASSCHASPVVAPIKTLIVELGEESPRTHTLMTQCENAIDGLFGYLPQVRKSAIQLLQVLASVEYSDGVGKALEALPAEQAEANAPVLDAQRPSGDYGFSAGLQGMAWALVGALKLDPAVVDAIAGPDANLNNCVSLSCGKDDMVSLQEDISELSRRIKQLYLEDESIKDSYHPVKMHENAALFFESLAGYEGPQAFQDMMKVLLEGYKEQIRQQLQAFPPLFKTGIQSINS